VHTLPWRFAQFHHRRKVPLHWCRGVTPECTSAQPLRHQQWQQILLGLRDFRGQTVGARKGAAHWGIIVLEALENNDLAAWVRESPSVFAYTGVLTVHAIGLAIVVGVNTLISFRLLGFAKGLPLTALRSTFGAVWFGFTINAVSGVLLFIAEATKMAVMPAFIGKMSFVALGMVVNHFMKSRYFSDTKSVQAGVVTPLARKLAWVNLVCWYLALITGRLTGYPDLVTSWFHI